jgi:addiction module HigA family antidote
MMYGFLAIHPGEHLQDEMKARKLSVSRLAKQLGIEKDYLEQVLAGNATITRDLASALEQAWGTPAKTWLELQKRFDTHPKNTHGGKREGAGRKSTGTISKILRANASKKEMNTIMTWLDKQPNKARAVADALYKQASR